MVRSDEPCTRPPPSATVHGNCSLFDPWVWMTSGTVVGDMCLVVTICVCMYVCVFVCVCACACVCMCEWLCVCVCACVRACVRVDYPGWSNKECMYAEGRDLQGQADRQQPSVLSDPQ